MMQDVLQAASRLRSFENDYLACYKFKRAIKLMRDLYKKNIKNLITTKIAWENLNTVKILWVLEISAANL